MSQQYVLDKNKRTSVLTGGAAETERLKQELAEYKSLYMDAQAEMESLKLQLHTAESNYNLLVSSRAWKLTAPLRATIDAAKALSPLHLLKAAYHIWKRHLFALRTEGLSGIIKAHQEDWHLRELQLEGQEGRYINPVLKKQRSERFPRDICFSILVPLYNTPKRYLKEMIRSVQEQTYPNWELCLADGSDEAHAYVGRICAALARKDKRIRYQKLEQNLGISENTNACLRMAAGDYVGLLDHDDYLCPAALYEVMKAICEKDADFIYTDESKFSTNVRKTFEPNFKPDFAPDSLRCVNYICHFSVFSKALSDRVGGFRSECDGAQDFDLILRLTEQAQNIVHIPKVLYLWRVHSGSTAAEAAAKPYVSAAGRRAVKTHLKRIGMHGRVVNGAAPSVYRVIYPIQNNPLISILIPSYEHIDDLRKCLNSIYEKSTYRNFEVIIIENNSHNAQTFRYYEEAKKSFRNLRVVVWKSEFNYSAINNFGAQFARGEYLLLLNNDTEVISPNWMQEMLMYAQRPDVGAVGAKLYYSDNTIQHAGVIIGLGGVAGHSHKGYDRFNPGYMRRLTYVQDVGAVTAACMMLPKRVWDEIGGLDESYKVAFNDVDMCMRIRKSGHLIVWTPFAELYHYESKSRGYEDTLEKQQRFAGEIRRFQKQWAAELAAGDPYYNANLSLAYEDLRPKQASEYAKMELQ